MKIGYITTYDVLNPSKWAKYNLGNYGSNYYIFQSLVNQGLAVETVGNFQKKYSWLTRSKWSLYRNFYHKDYYRWAEPIVCKNYADQITKKLEKSDIDIILCTEGATPVAYLKYQKPLVLWIDTVLAALIDVYPYLSNLCRETRKNIHLIEKSALDSAKLVIFSSEWAAQEARRIYKVNSEKIKVIPRGANLELKPERSLDAVKEIINSRGKETYKLTFVGVDWIRKGGEIALAVSHELKTMGLNIELRIIGDLPKNKNNLPNFVRLIGYIDKSQVQGKKYFYQLLADSHFLILPTQADVTPNVLIEANAFGVPCLTTNLAGIPTIIKDDINGKTFPKDAKIADYCNYIITYLLNYSQYKNLAISSFNEYRSRLNWLVAGEMTKNLFMNLLSS
jgi:glycosyltransferase involved in cell wall biosynthesis